MTRTTESLYELLPELYRQKDVGKDLVMKALMGVIGEQARVIEDDIAKLYENWFIETCDDWVVPYIGDLIGWRHVHEAGEPADPVTQRARQLNKILIPRREAANTIRYRRRKGTIALLELLAHDVAGWPARAVEFFRLTAFVQSVNHVRLERGRTVDLHDVEVLERLDGPFDQIAHTVDVRRVNSTRTPGRYNNSNVGLFVWRLKPYKLTRSDACALDTPGPYPGNRFTFDVIGKSCPLFTCPTPEGSPDDLAGPLNVPHPIGRRAFEKHLADYYGPGKSLQIFEEQSGVLEPVAIERIVAADLTSWRYEPMKVRREGREVNEVAVDPVLGRIKFPASKTPRRVQATYHYGFSSDMGGGEYARRIEQPDDVTIYRVAKRASDDENGNEFSSLAKALSKWASDLPHRAVIEIQESGRANIDKKGKYDPLPEISIPNGFSLQIRAANGKRPSLFLNDSRDDENDDSFRVFLGAGSQLTLDGLLVARGALWLDRNPHCDPDEYSAAPPVVSIRHCTFVPGYFALNPAEEPSTGVPSNKAERQEPKSWGDRPSILMEDLSTHLHVEKSILGPIKINKEEARTDPVVLQIADSVLDAGRGCTPAIAGEHCAAHANLSFARTTVIGSVSVHAIDLAENSIFLGPVRVQRRQVGCIRFCYVPRDSQTPRRYRCQPDLAVQAGSSVDQVRPVFNSLRYGAPDYCQLAQQCPEEIRRGADDESEMGAFHDLYQPQREANLQARLAEYTPIDTNVAIIYAT